MIGEVGELRNWGPIQQLLRKVLRQRRTEIGRNHKSREDKARTWGLGGSWKKETLGMNR